MSDASKPATPGRVIERFVLETVAEAGEIPGRELVLDGKTYLVTTETQIAEWLSWYTHCEDPDAPSEDADGHPQVVCLCGQGYRGETWQEAHEAMDAHLAEARQKIIRAAGGNRIDVDTPT